MAEFRQKDRVEVHGKSGTTNKIWIDGDNLAVVSEGEVGRYVTLSDYGRRKLALKLLEKLFDINAEYNAGWLGDEIAIILTPKRPPARVGEFYRVVSDSEMNDGWEKNPIVRVKEVSGDSMLVELKNGSTSSWSTDLEGLVGPLNVVEVVVESIWAEKDEADG